MKYEIAVQAVDYRNPKRAQVGDIITVRQVRGAIGRKEVNHLIWFTVDSPVDLNVRDFRASVRDAKGGVVAKRRFSIGSDLSRLKTIMPSFDLAKAANANEVYQPFLNLDERLGKQQSKQDLPLTGLIVDKDPQIR